MKTVNRSISSLSFRTFLGSVLLVAGATSPAWAGDGGTLLGGGLGAAAGAVIGQSVGGKNGAIVSICSARAAAALVVKPTGAPGLSLDAWADRLLAVNTRSCCGRAAT